MSNNNELRKESDNCFSEEMEDVENVLIEEIILTFNTVCEKYREQYKHLFPDGLDGFKDHFRTELRTSLKLPVRKGDCFTETHLNVLYGIIHKIEERCKTLENWKNSQTDGIKTSVAIVRHDNDPKPPRVT